MTDFFNLMKQCFGFLSKQWNIWGFNFSLLNVMLFVEVFQTVMNTVCALFGQAWEWGDYYDR